MGVALCEGGTSLTETAEICQSEFSIQRWSNSEKPGSRLSITVKNNGAIVPFMAVKKQLL
jgi:hypothetical protein